MKKLTFLVVFLLSTSSAFTVFAGDNKFFDHFDRDNDGKLSLSELPNSKMSEMDTNNDGYVSESEMAAGSKHGIAIEPSDVDRHSRYMMPKRRLMKDRVVRKLP
jgi:hypothetical protein